MKHEDINLPPCLDHFRSFVVSPAQPSIMPRVSGVWGAGLAIKQPEIRPMNPESRVLIPVNGTPRPTHDPEDPGQDTADQGASGRASGASERVNAYARSAPSSPPPPDYPPAEGRVEPGGPRLPPDPLLGGHGEYAGIYFAEAGAVSLSRHEPVSCVIAAHPSEPAICRVRSLDMEKRER